MSHFKPEFCTLIEPGMPIPSIKHSVNEQVKPVNQIKNIANITATQEIEDLISRLDRKQLINIIKSAKKRLKEINFF